MSDLSFDLSSDRSSDSKSVFRGSRFRLLFAFALVATAACHPLGCCAPAALPVGEPLALQDDALANDVEILVDDMGIPHVYGEDMPELAYGLGFMHGRERRFQITVVKHAATGRLSEILGSSYLNSDRYLRIFTYRLDEQIAAMSDRDRTLLETYTAGLNQGAKNAGNSSEMNLLGLVLGSNFDEEFTLRDVLSIIRFFQNDQSTALTPELARSLIQANLPASDPRRQALLVAVPADDIPIVRTEEFAGTRDFQPQTPPKQQLPFGTLAPTPAKPATQAQQQITSQQRELDEKVRVLLDKILFEGASNSWVVSGSKTESGNAVLANDPHLGHGIPGIFYMAHLNAPDWTITGVSFPGIPAILIGHGDNIAWGITNSFADGQDLVRLQTVSGKTTHYELDGAAMPFGTLTQTYKLGPGDDAETFTEQWRTSIFGPVLPGGWDGRYDARETYAYMWTAYNYPEKSADLMGSWWDLARASTLDEALPPLQSFFAPPMNFAMAFTDGTIGYHTSGIIPVRKSTGSVLVPRNGRTRNGGWAEPVPFEFKPTLRNPERGFIVSSNQRIVADDGPIAHLMGGEAAEPYRAERITKELQALVDAGKVSNADILDIQQNTRSAQADRILEALQAACVRDVSGHPAELVGTFCDRLEGFDGDFTLDSEGALAYLVLERELREVIIERIVGVDAAPRVQSQRFVHLAVHNALRAEFNELPAPLLDNPATGRVEGIAAYIEEAQARALDVILEVAGEDPVNWRWGNVHKTKWDGLLAGQPVIGGMFQTERVEQSGCNTCVHAEGPLDVTFGSGLRFIAEMSSPIQAKMVIDTGNSGHWGSPHMMDQFPLWNSGEPMVLARTRAEVEERLEGWVKITP